MAFKKYPPYERELRKLILKEEKYLSKHEEVKTGFLNKALEGKVPSKLQETLNLAFFKAFEVIFKKGTPLIEKMSPRDKMKDEFKLMNYTQEVKKTSSSLRAFDKKAKGRGNLNLLISASSGIGMGALGIGIPDIPLFTAMIIKEIIEVSLSYGFNYKDEGERYFMLLIIKGAVSYGEELKAIDLEINRLIRERTIPKAYDEKELIKKTSDALSNELLYMKFLQGIPVAGAVGGLYDGIYMKKISTYANLKYRRKFLVNKIYLLNKKS